MLKFLNDECLSPKIASFARSRGYHAEHVNWLGLTGFRDNALMPIVLGEDFVFVTNNGADFRPIYRALDVHPGLVVILPAVNRPAQIDLFQAMIERLESEPDTINKLIEVSVDAKIAITDFPPFRDNI